MEPMSPSSVQEYPLTLEIRSDETVDRWRPFFNWVLATPQIIIVNALSAVSSALAFLSFFSVLFTRRVPDSFYQFQAMALRHGAEVGTFAFGLTGEYPPFSFEMVGEDPGDYPPARLSVREPGEMNRWLVLVKWILLIPMVFVLLFWYTAAMVGWFVNAFAVLFTGRTSDRAVRWFTSLLRVQVRTNWYGYFLTDEYPPFSGN